MGHLSIEADATKHTGKMSVDQKAIDSRCPAGKNDIQRFFGVLWYFGGKGKAVTRTHRDNTHAGFRPGQGSHDGTYRSIAAADDDIGNFLLLNDGPEEVVIAFCVGRIYAEFNILPLGPLGYQLLQR